MSNCTVWGIGAKGVVLDDATHSALSDSHIYDTGCGGAVVSGGDFVTLQPGHNVASGNEIHDVCNYKRSYQPGLLWAGVGNTYRHNYLHVSAATAGLGLPRPTIDRCCKQSLPHNCILGGGNQGPGANNVSAATNCHHASSDASRLQVFEYNTLEQCAFESADTGAMYTCGQQANGKDTSLLRPRPFQTLNEAAAGCLQPS